MEMDDQLQEDIPAADDKENQPRELNFCTFSVYIKFWVIFFSSVVMSFQLLLPVVDK